MKKLSFVFLFILIIPFIVLSGCKEKEFSLADYADEIRSDIFVGKSQNYSIKANYGYNSDKHFTKKTDDDKNYYLTFYLLGEYDTNIAYSIEFNLNGKNYKDFFSYSNKKNGFCVSFPVEQVAVKKIDACIQSSSKRENISLDSIVPSSTLSYVDALKKLYSQQKTYIDGFIENETFNAYLSVRILVKDNKSYYYVGIKDKNESLKAMLIDGKTGEVLAIREVF